MAYRTYLRQAVRDLFPKKVNPIGPSYVPSKHTRSDMPNEMISSAVFLLADSTLVEASGRNLWRLR